VPTYEYRCKNGHTFEAVQSMSDDPLTTCPTCGAEVQRVFHPVAVHFKGSGFYTTDYGKKKGAGAASSDSSSSDSKDSGSKDSGSKDASPKSGSDKKSEKASSGSGSDS
jgi:putative FmdB family regulatory protein